jgi:uncharacterized RDD family membrane protein YckC
MTAGGVSPVPREARPYQGKRAGLVTRLVVATIDAGVVGVILAAGYAGLNALVFMLDPRGFSFIGGSLLTSMMAALTLTVLYLTASWASTGRSYGCHLMGLRVVGRRGGKPGLVVAWLRALGCTFFPIGLVWCAWSTGNRSLQDLVLRTSVIYDWMPRAAPAEEASAEPQDA